MARNRKRAKERRARRQVANGARGHVAAADGEEAAPDPIEHAAPDVELAEAQLAIGRAEAEAEPLPAEELETEAELEPADELEADEDYREDDYEEEEPEDDGADGRGPPVGTAVAPTEPGVPEPRARPRGRLIGFLQGSWRELQRVQWPDRRQVVQATGVVIGFVIIAGLYLAAADAVASKLMDYILK